MTHINESAFGKRVLERLRAIYGPENVHEQVVLDNTSRVVDIHVETPDASDDLAIEIENDWESAFEGFGQSILYSHQLDAQPVIIVPVGHVEFPEAFYLAAEGVTIFQFPVE